jgi:vacuolar protein sorting-associated protein 26
LHLRPHTPHQIKSMELLLVRCESGGEGDASYAENETLLKWDLMDGAPVRGESIPVRTFLSNVEPGLQLCPSASQVRRQAGTLTGEQPQP